MLILAVYEDWNQIRQGIIRIETIENPEVQHVWPIAVRVEYKQCMSTNSDSDTPLQGRGSDPSLGLNRTIRQKLRQVKVDLPAALACITEYGVVTQWMTFKVLWTQFFNLSTYSIVRMPILVVDEDWNQYRQGLIGLSKIGIQSWIWVRRSHWMDSIKGNMNPVL